MSVDERARHQLFVKLEEVLGAEEAITLMETLPPIGYGELVTKDYLDLRLAAMEDRLAAKMSEQMSQQTRTMVFTLVAVVLSISGIALFR